MKVSELAEKLGARVVTNLDKAGEAAVERFFMSDGISELLNASSETTLLVTSLANPHLARVAELMDVPAVCLVGGLDPDERLLDAAERRGIVLMVSELGGEDAAMLLRACLPEAGGTET